MDLLKTIKAVHKIRDPIYGYIWFTEDEKEIIDDPLFQRLRRIHQLALTKYVYPSAEHTRFVHSLGVLQAATNIFLEFVRINHDPGWTQDQLVKNFKILRFASLLHDIGHLPFSHGLEKVLLGNKVKHEHVSQYLIENHAPFQKVFEKNDLSPKLIASLIYGQYPQKYRFLKKIISHEFDADRADYLLRDSYICGVKYGEYDYIRYSSCFRLIEFEGQKELVVDFGNIHLVESFLLARYFYLTQVAYHRTRVGFDLALEKYVSQLQERNRLPGDIIQTDDTKAEIADIDIDEFHFFDDSWMLEKIKSDFRAHNKWARILMRAKHLKPIFDREIDEPVFKNDYTDLLNDLETEGLHENEDYFQFTKPIKIHKLFSKSDEKEDKNLVPIVNKYDDNQIIGDLLEFSPIISQISNNKTVIRRIYLAPEALESTKPLLESHKQKWAKRREKQRGAS